MLSELCSSDMGVHYIATSLLLLGVFDSGFSCPPWFIEVNTTSSDFPQCVCNKAVESIVYCDQMKEISSVKVGHCVYQYQNETVAANCPYLYPLDLIQDGLIRLPQKLSELNNFTCFHLQREEGKLFCGRCKNGTGPSIYSFGSQCRQCEAINILYYLLLQYGPITIIFLVVLLFRFNTVSPPMAHYIFYCNIVMVGLKADMGQYIFVVSPHTLPIRLMLTLNSLCTFDTLYFLSPSLCVSEKIRDIYIPILDTLAALYPFLLLLLTYIAIELHARDCKPIVFLWKLSVCNKLFGTWNHEKSLIQAFATLFFLSFVKFFGIVTDSMILTCVHDMNGRVIKTVYFTDHAVLPFSYGHLPIVFLSAIVLIFILLPPTLLLLLYPTCCFRRFSKCLKPRCLLTLMIFTDMYYGTYKNGLKGTKDYRPVAGFVFIVWILFGVTYIFVYGAFRPDMSRSVIFIPLSIATSLACLVFEPYKDRRANISGALLVLNITAVSAIFAILDVYTYSETLVWCLIAVMTLPHCVMCAYGVMQLVRWIKSRTTADIGPNCAIYEQNSHLLIEAVHS